jgi:transposase
MAPRWLTILSKFADHLPFYRQEEIFKRQGIDLDRGTLGNWGEETVPQGSNRPVDGSKG